MDDLSKSIEYARQSQTESQSSPLKPEMASTTSGDPEISNALRQLKLAQERFLSAAVAFCDGVISDGQLRAARELLREKELRIMQLARGQQPSLVEDMLPEDAPVKIMEEIITKAPTAEPVEQFSIPEDISPEFKQKLIEVSQKLDHLEHEFQLGHINPSQYRAIRRHYLEQREVAIRMQEMHPGSKRWQVVLENGKTTFLMQLNEATCLSIGIYDIQTRERIYVQGSMPPVAEEAMSLLGTFGNAAHDSSTGRMYATQTDDGASLLLIPGRYSACLVVFSQTPPNWQVRALREVHRHFETANKAALERGQRKSLIYPNLRRFIRL